MSALLLSMSLALAQPSVQTPTSAPPPVQTPSSTKTTATSTSTSPAGTTTTTTTSTAPSGTTAADSSAPSVQSPKSGNLPAWDPSATGAVPAAPVEPPVPVPVAETPAAPPADAASSPVEKAGPPFYTESDMQQLRTRHGLEATAPTSERKSRWRCLIADPTCGLVVEVQATSGYAYRVRQGDVTSPGDLYRWSSARVQYDVWVSIPTLVESRGSFKYTRVSLGPKGGIIASDSKDVWGNVGFAGRYWFKRTRWSPTIEFSSGLAFKVAGIQKPDGRFDNVRSPIGFVADVGIGLGGFGAIVLGGQFDSPLAREDVPERARTPAAGMFYIGFRGNILWGAPAVFGVATHAAALRGVNAP
ncbi:hypothetical protein [Nannocystis punicea]|uniref:Outer membrane protein beta-barrel domain-containing protein n=1 Tax=Nannocystis punicea TaxID=2995304 RepID=A0ABY7H4U0_9BACT|nr:hypothetical protein [Nannocystis poenicansa]WAS94286.1 hypothetical protein O0S08_49830 [Nannocystis poenicansa]